jgi:hypothetical protein
MVTFVVGLHRRFVFIVKSFRKFSFVVSTERERYLELQHMHENRGRKQTKNWKEKVKWFVKWCGRKGDEN